MNKVYIIILNWNGWQDTIECLESLQSLDYSAYTVVICDNGSKDESLHRLRDWMEARDIDWAEYTADQAETGGIPSWEQQFVLIRNGANLGFAGGNNVGLRYAMARNDFDYAWLLNNDTVVDPDALASLVRRMQERPDAGMCGSTLRLYHNRDRIQALGGGYYCRWIGLPWHYGRFTTARKTPDGVRAEARMNYVEGASMLVSRQFLDGVGLLCEDYFLYFEEADWAIRAKGLFTLGYAPKSLVYHKVGASIGTSSNPAKKSLLCDFYNIRNRLLFTRRFYPEALWSVRMVVFGALLLRLCMGRWDRAKMIAKLLVSPAGHDVTPPEGRKHMNVLVPRITVITVVKNGAGLLEETILSVIEQKLTTQVDFLIVDGGSTDGTVEVIRRYAEHISWWVSEPDRGIYDAMNKGWTAAADGSFIMFLGAGDRIISLPAPIGCCQGHDVVYGAVRMGEKNIFKARTDFHLKLYNSLHHQALLVQKSFHPAPPFDCSYLVYADFDFNQRLKKSGARFVHAPDFVTYARPGGLSDAQDFQESLSIIRKNYGWLWELFAVSAFLAMRVFPVLRRLRPVRKP